MTTHIPHIFCLFCDQLISLSIMSSRFIHFVAYVRISFLCFFLRFFLMWTIFFFLKWTIFKVFIEFVTILLLFYVLVFWLRGMWDLSSPTRDRTRTPCIGRRSLNHWTTSEVPEFPSFLRLNNIPLCMCIYIHIYIYIYIYSHTTFCLSIYPLMDA